MKTFILFWNPYYGNNNLIFDVLPYDPLFFVRKSNLDVDLEVLMNIFLKKVVSYGDL